MLAAGRWSTSSGRRGEDHGQGTGRRAAAPLRRRPPAVSRPPRADARLHARLPPLPGRCVTTSGSRRASHRRGAGNPRRPRQPRPAPADRRPHRWRPARAARPCRARPPRHRASSARRRLARRDAPGEPGAARRAPPGWRAHGVVLPRRARRGEPRRLPWSRRLVRLDPRRLPCRPRGGASSPGQHDGERGDGGRTARALPPRRRPRCRPLERVLPRARRAGSRPRRALRHGDRGRARLPR